MTEENTASTDTTETPGFGIQDLIFSLQVYEACAQRGAFRADEMSNVGQVYDRLKAFLIANGAIPDPTAATTTSTETTTGEQ
jgi:hypothetical protein